MPEPQLTYGVAPGLRFAVVFDGRGGCRDLDWDGVRAWEPGQGTLWVHLERDSREAQAWLIENSGLDRDTVRALLAEESRPRVECSEDSLLVFLRGVNRNAADDPVDLVPIHLWASPGRVISLRDRDHYLLALRDIRQALEAGRGPRSAGELLVRIAEKVMKYVEPIVEELDEECDRLDHQSHADMSRDWRSALGDLRRNAIGLRRYLAPQREALYRLQVEEVVWLSRGDRVGLREITDRTVRFVESLDVIRDRATLLHEDLTAQISERISLTSNRLTALAAVLLPPSLIAGLFGMNVDGVPGSGHSHGFWIISGLMLLVMVAEVWLLRRLKWI